MNHSESSYTFRRYEPSMRHLWDCFAAASRNATFLFGRSYMDYHSDRFADCSMIAYAGGRPVAMLPADITGDGVLHSHRGLTYGGWMLPAKHLDLPAFTRMWDDWLRHCAAEGIKAIDYKPLPYIYAGTPSQEDLYMLFRCGARLTECSPSATVDLRAGWSFNSMMRRHLRAAQATGAMISETADSGRFMELVAACLAERHHTSPVHSASEMELLRTAHPRHIRMFAVSLPESPGVFDAGMCIYDTGLVAHAQYIATTPRGRGLNLLPLLCHRLMSDVFAGRRYFDFGISTEDAGRHLNDGLARQKNSFGATATACQRYMIDLDAYRP